MRIVSQATYSLSLQYSITERRVLRNDSEAIISIDIHVQQWLRLDHTPGAGN